MNIHDYLIDPSGKNWAALLHDWIPPLPTDATLWLVNRLGEVFVVTDDNAVLWLDLETGNVQQVAHSREHFAQLLDAPGNADKWLKIQLIDACLRIGMIINTDQCYALKIPTRLGGKYEVTNIAPKDLANHYSFMAHIHKQTEVYWVPEN